MLAALAVGLAVFYYFTGDAVALPVRLVPHLQAVPLTLDSVAVGRAHLPVQVSGFIVSLTHDVAGPFNQPMVAGALLALLALLLAGWTAVASTLARRAFVAGMVPVIFLLLSLNTELLGVFDTSKRYFLYLMLGLVGGVAFGLHAFAERMPFWPRAVVLGGVVAGLGGLLFGQSQLPAPETALQLAAYATPAGAVLVLLLVLWTGIENVRALLWFNSQAERPGSRFGLGPLVAASGLYLGTLGLYLWNNDTLQLLPNLRFDPLVLLLPAALAGGAGLRLRAPSYGAWVPYRHGLAILYPLVVAGAAGTLAYAFATANTPLLAAARHFTALAFFLLGTMFLVYVLINFGPLIRQRLRVYRVAFEPRRLPFYTVYLLAVSTLVIVQLRAGLVWFDQVKAGQYNNLGDLARAQSEARPDDLGLALLAERYYAESSDVLARFNEHAQFGRAAIYRFRQQRQNEINALRRALLREPSEKASLRLAGLYTEPGDLFEGLDVLRGGLRAQPRGAALAGDLAQLFTKTALTDSVAHYLDRAERLAPGSYASRTNQLGFLLSQNLLAEARKLNAADLNANQPALVSNSLLLQLLNPAPSKPIPNDLTTNLRELDGAGFALLYHRVLLNVRHPDQRLTPVLLAQLPRLASLPANAGYAEQLQFLQALLRHALGQELAARQLLAPLAAGTTATAGYYQQLLGLWQLQQGQYTTAADQLALAATHGGTLAAEARAYALALGGRPDSAKAVAARLLASPDSAARRLGQRVSRQLAAGVLGPAANSAGRVGGKWLAAARQAGQLNHRPEAARQYQRLVREAPFNESAMLAAAGFFTRQRDYAAAYDALRAGLDENPHSRPLLQAYVLAAADAGLTEYGAGALAELRPRLRPAEYATLAADYATHRAARAAATASFSTAPAAPLLP